MAQLLNNTIAWPDIVKADEVSKLLLLQWLYRQGIVSYSPLDDVRFVCALGSEGIEVAEEGWEKRGLLKKLSELEVYKIELRLMDRFERAAVRQLERLVDAGLRRRLDWKNAERRIGRRSNARHKRYNRKRYAARKARRIAAGEQIGTKKEPVMKRQASEPKKEEQHFAPVANPVLKEDRNEDIKRVELERSVTNSERPEVEVEVMRVGPNPRVVICRYMVLAEERRVNVFVKTNKNFRRGMKWKLNEQEGSEWKYEGNLPRRLGVW